MDLSLKKHAETRARQRGFRRADLDLIVRYGTQTRDGVLLRKSDVNNRVSELKHEIGALERLRGVFVVLDGASVITLYRASRKKHREQLK